MKKIGFKFKRNFRICPRVWRWSLEQSNCDFVAAVFFSLELMAEIEEVEHVRKTLESSGEMLNIRAFSSHVF